MFEIVDDNDKRITISLHLEQIVIEMSEIQHFKQEISFFNYDRLSKSCVDTLIKLKFDCDLSKYVLVLDFKHIKYIDVNIKGKLKEWIDTNFSSVEVVGDSDIDEGLLRTFKDCKKSTNSYIQAFNNYGRKYIIEKCLKEKKYVSQTGITLNKYIDIKKIITDDKEMIRWCYILAEKIKEYYSSIEESLPVNLRFFCHTLNGAFIAGVLSLLLGSEIVYVDHLGPYNRLNKIDLHNGINKSNDYIIVTDMICLGNEFIRAKNIAEYIGGNVIGCVGIVRFNISDLLKKYQVVVFDLDYESEEIKKTLRYTIETSLSGREG